MPFPSATTMAILPSSSSSSSSSLPIASSSSSSTPFSLSPKTPPLLRYSPSRKPSPSFIARPIRLRRPSGSVCCEVALKPDVGPSSPEGVDGLSPEEEEELKRYAAKEGARVRVKVPLKVYHVPKVPEVDLTGMEGVVKQYVCFWKGKRVSANLPFKIQFQLEVEGRGIVKFFAHLKEDEIEFI